jgi:hypothetical protein
LPATLDQDLELVPVVVPAVPDVDVAKTSRSSRSRGRRGRASTSGEAAPEAAAQSEAATEPVVEATAPQASVDIAPAAEGKTPAKSSRSRSRRKGDAQQAEIEGLAQAPTLDEAEMPMETTVSAEHLTREEIVEAQPEQPARGKGRSARRRDKQREIDAPTAAAAETEAAAQAILVEAEVEPGAQIPAEVEAAAAQPEMTSPPAAPAQKSRTRRGSGRKSEAQQAAEATVEAAAEGNTETAVESPIPQPVEPAPVQEQAPKKGRGRGRSSTRAAVEQPKAPAAEPQVAGVRDPEGTPLIGPHTGVEIINTEERNGQKFHTMRDLRDGTTVHNVTRKSARRLWFYAILQHEHGDPAYAEIAWHPNEMMGLWRREHRAGASRYDLVARYPDGSLRIFYGVTDDGISGAWQELVQMATEAEYWGPPAVEK